MAVLGISQKSKHCEFQGEIVFLQKISGGPLYVRYWSQHYREHDFDNLAMF